MASKALSGVGASSSSNIPYGQRVLCDPKKGRPLAQKTRDWFQSWPRMCGYAKHHTAHPRIYTSNQWKPKSEGLVVLVHGLGEDGPVCFSLHVSILEKHPTIDILTPQVVKDGRCPLKESVAPIFDQIADYAKKHPKMPVSLIGVSNGSRIVVELEIEMRSEHPSTPVRVSTIAGILKGTWGVNLLGCLRIPQCLQRIGWARKFPLDLCKELQVGSKASRELVANMKAPLPENCAPRSFQFIAPAHDWMILNRGSSLPNLGIGEEECIVYGHGHLSVVAAVALEQIEGCLAWMKDQS